MFNYFGIENYLKLFHIFYVLSQVTEETQNHPLLLFMDQRSVVKGFRFIFDIDIEEVAIRFYTLFV